jgi:hypothetical protein
MIRQEMPLQNLALFLTSKVMKYFTKLFPELAIKYLPPAFWYPNHMVLAFPL